MANSMLVQLKKKPNPKQEKVHTACGGTEPFSLPLKQCHAGGLP